MRVLDVRVSLSGFLGEALQKEFTENKSFLMSMTLEAGDVTDGGGKGAL